MRKIDEMLESGENVGDLLNRIKIDFKFFYEKILGFNEKGGLNEYKKEWFKLAYDNDYVMIQAPSGFAKTTVIGVAFVLWWVLTHENQKVLIISKSQDQARDNIFTPIRNLIEDNEFLLFLKPSDRETIWNQSQLVLANNSTITIRPYNINIKSYRANIIILDEIDSYENTKIYFDYVLSRLIPGGKIIGISTPEEGTGNLMDLILLRDKTELNRSGLGECVFKKYTAIINYSDYNELSDGESIWPEEFPMEELMRRKIRFGREKFYKNYMCDSMTECEDSIFKATDIADCIRKDLKYTPKRMGGEIYIGIDFAISSSPTGDYDAYVVIEKIKDVAYIKFAETVKGLPPEEKVRRMENLQKKYNPVYFICDESTYGHEVIRQAMNRGLPILSQSFQPNERNKLLSNLISLISNHKIMIPKHPDDLQAIEFANILEYELLKFIEYKNPNTGYKSFVSKAKHDDSVMGLAMAVKHVQIMQDFDDYIGVA